MRGGEITGNWSSYRPSRSGGEDPLDRLARDFRGGRLTAEQLLSRYCALVYRQTGSYEETARRLGIDRRTGEEQTRSG
jgi:hypothetical protein